MFGARMIFTPTAGVVDGLIDKFAGTCQYAVEKSVDIWRGRHAVSRTPVCKTRDVPMRLIVSGLTGGRGGEALFAGLTFAIEGGEALVVTGPNGVGKSTMLRMIAGLLAPDAGDIRVEGLPEGAEQIREVCHYLGHRNGMKRELTVRENLDFWAALPGASNGVTVEEAAGRVGLPQLLHLPFGYLSAGQQRRIALAKLLVTSRPIWVLDEPTGALDMRSEAMFAEMVNAHLDSGGLALIATHQPLAIQAMRSLELVPLAPEASSLEWSH